MTRSALDASYVPTEESVDFSDLSELRFDTNDATIIDDEGRTIAALNGSAVRGHGAVNVVYAHHLGRQMAAAPELYRSLRFLRAWVSAMPQSARLSTPLPPNEGGFAGVSGHSINTLLDRIEEEFLQDKRELAATIKPVMPYDGMFTDLGLED